jgi:hypothetical protein
MANTASYVSKIVTFANAVPANNGTLTTVMSVDLTPGEWNINGELWIRFTSGTPTVSWMKAAISSSNAAQPDDPADDIAVNEQSPAQTKSASTTTGNVLPMVTMHVDLTQTTTFYLTGNITWTGTASVVFFGYLGGTYAAAPGILTDGTVTIAAGESLSNALDCTKASVVSVLMPANWTPAVLSFQMSTDNVNFYDVYDATGIQVVRQIGAGTGVPVLPWSDTANYIKVRSGTRSAPVPQNETVTLIAVMQ